MHLVDRIRRVEQVRLAGARRGPAHIDTAHRPRLTQDNGAAGATLMVGPMPNAIFSKQVGHTGTVLDVIVDAENQYRDVDVRHPALL